jgi:hypothetical protein
LEYGSVHRFFTASVPKRATALSIRYAMRFGCRWQRVNARGLLGRRGTRDTKCPARRYIKSDTLNGGGQNYANGRTNSRRRCKAAMPGFRPGAGRGGGAGSTLHTSCAREAGVNAGESPVGAIRRFSTADRANSAAVRRGGEQAWSRTGRSQCIYELPGRRVGIGRPVGGRAIKSLKK